MEQQFEAITMNQLEEHYKQLQQEIYRIDFEQMSEKDRQLLKEQKEIREFYTEVSDSLAFVSQTAEMTMGKDEMEIHSMLPPEEYGKLLNTLSDNRSEDFEKFLMQEKISDRSAEERSEDLLLIQKIPENAMQSAELKEAVQTTEQPEYTVKEVQQAVEKTDLLMQNFGIEKDSELPITMQTGMAFSDMKEEGKLLKLEREETPEQQAEKQEQEQPVTITESSDGYIQNTSRTLNAGDMKQVAVDYNVENGNEIHHEVAMETTNDPSKVSPVVHLEEGNVSTLEAEVGITEETKRNYSDMER